MACPKMLVRVMTHETCKIILDEPRREVVRRKISSHFKNSDLAVTHVVSKLIVILW